jgi:hypothetical protein
METLFKRVLRKIRSDKILNKIDAGRTVYFENPLEEIALKYIPGGPGKTGKYYAKHYGRNEYEIDSDSSSILMAIMEGKQIRKIRYDNYHLIVSTYWSRNPENSRSRQNYRYVTNGWRSLLNASR